MIDHVGHIMIMLLVVLLIVCHDNRDADDFLITIQKRVSWAKLSCSSIVAKTLNIRQTSTNKNLQCFNEIMISDDDSYKKWTSVDVYQLV